jgi:hypothetical protein
MSIADELRKLGELHQSGALTDAEFAQAKARVLAGERAQDGGPQDETLREHLSELKRENELARLDREWQMERDRYQMSGRYGGRYTPTKASGIIMAVVTAGFGVVWTVMAAGMGGGIGGPGAIFPLFGVVFVLVGIGVGAFTFFRARQFEDAQQRYQRRRAMILAGDEEELPEPGSRYAARSSSTAIQDISEAAPCVSCGKTIPAGQERCPNCGWTYT